MKQMFFTKTSVKRDKTEVIGKEWPVRVAEDNSVTLRQINALRIVGFGLVPLVEGQGKDGLDVSGCGKDSPNQIIWDGEQFVAVPYSDEYVRTGTGEKGETGLLVVSELMANHHRREGRPQKGEKAKLIPEPITTYNEQVYIAITGALKRHKAVVVDRFKSMTPLRIDLTNVQGFNDEHFEDLQIANDMIGCPVEWLR